MRVLHVIKGLGPGGAERLLVSLAGVRGPDVEMDVAYVLPGKSHLVADLEAAGAEVSLVGGSRGLADPRWVLRLLRLVRHTRPDVVHLHSPAVAAVARPVLRALRDGPTVVTTEHNVWASFGMATRVLNGLTLPASHAVLAVSEEVRSSVWRTSRERVEVSVQGIPADELGRRRGERTAARAELGVGDGDLLVVTVANLREKKDYPNLLAAAARCVTEPHLTFAAIGQGPLEAELQRRHRTIGLGERFRFLGYHPDPPRVVAGADVFVLASRHEGLPIALLEAMALAVPPVVTAVGGIPEVVTHEVDGLLVAPGDDAALAAAILRLARHPEQRAALGRAAAQRAREFDVARTQQELERRYRSLRER